MTREDIIRRLRETHPEMTEGEIDTSLENLLRLGLIERRRELPHNLPLTAEAEAALVEEMSRRHPEAVVQAMVDRLVDTGILKRQP